MEKEDARRHSPEQLFARRKQGVRLRKQGHGVMEVVRLTGLSYPTVRAALDAYERGGTEALKPKGAGRKRGSGRTLSLEQECAVRALICDKRPEQLKMDFALWSPQAVMELIEREFGIRLAINSVGVYLKRWGFTPQKPTTRAYEQKPEVVQRWKAEVYPEIVKRAKTEGGEIHWADETSVVNNDVRGRGYAPMGKTPTAYTVGGTYERISMISSVTNAGKMRSMMVKDTFKSEQFIEFLEALIRDADRKVFLIVDNLRVHHSRAVKAWLEDKTDKIEPFFLPAYSPELNPDERLNADLKHALGTKVTQRTRKKLEQATTAHMEFIANNPERVKTYFKDPHVAYAA